MSLAGLSNGVIVSYGGVSRHPVRELVNANIGAGPTVGQYVLPTTVMAFEGGRAVTLQDKIIADIYDEHRGFLPGERCTVDEVARHMEGSVKLDNISDEERLLLLSTLPRNAEQLWISQMDKGLSGSTVFAIRYSDTAGRHSKPFVAKIGELIKIQSEDKATRLFAAPYLPDIATPVCRRGETLALIAQELHGLNSQAQPESLRNYMRKSDDGPAVVQRLLEERLYPWYSRSKAATSPISVGDLMTDYLRRGPTDIESVLPSGWDELTEWTRRIGGFGWADVGSTVASVLAGTIDSPVSIIHGDLHTQNVLVDTRSRECWPIDFAWCREDSSPLIDLAMLECSLKFLAIPMRSDLRTLLAIEYRLATEPDPEPLTLSTPYSAEITRVIAAVAVLRNYVAAELQVPFSEFRKILLAMTYSLSSLEGLNRPFVIGSLQLLAGAAA